ncbi:MAG: stage III sporulation protein AF [Firmicutes bacterium]|nr:stage III sporulation protein AF [Bacillota bacterium]
MNVIFQWVKDIFIIIISLSFFNILVPDSSMAKYLNFIFSLLILAVILEPAMKYI